MVLPVPSPSSSSDVDGADQLGILLLLVEVVSFIRYRDIDTLTDCGFHKDSLRVRATNDR